MSNNNQAIIMAVGVGAIGTLLAYVGYSMSQKEQETTDNKEKSIFDSIPFLDSNNESKPNISVDVSNNNNTSESKDLKTSTFFNFWKTPQKIEDEVVKDAVKAAIEKLTKKIILENINKKYLLTKEYLKK